MLKKRGEVLGRNEASKMTGEEPVATKKTEQYSNRGGKRSPRENVDKEGKPIEE